jgi:hypothetical protein
MRIDDLRIVLKSLGKRYNRDFCVEAGNENVIVFWRLDGWTRIAEFSTKKQLFFKGYEDVFLLLPEDLIDDLTEVFIEFLKTPIPDREEKKRYHYVVKDIYRWILEDEKKRYLYYEDDEYGDVFLGEENEDTRCCTISTFTEDEIKKLLSTHYIPAGMFDKIEVE